MSIIISWIKLSSIFRLQSIQTGHVMKLGYSPATICFSRFMMCTRPKMSLIPCEWPWHVSAPLIAHHLSSQIKDREMSMCPKWSAIVPMRKAHHPRWRVCSALLPTDSTPENGIRHPKWISKLTVQWWSMIFSVMSFHHLSQSFIVVCHDYSRFFLPKRSINHTFVLHTLLHHYVPRD